MDVGHGLGAWVGPGVESGQRPCQPGPLFLRGGQSLPLGTGNLRWAPGWEFRRVCVQLECQFVVLCWTSGPQASVAWPGRAVCQCGLLP